MMFGHKIYGCGVDRVASNLSSEESGDKGIHLARLGGLTVEEGRGRDR